MKVTNSTVPEVGGRARPRRAPVPRVPRTFFYKKIVPAVLILIGVATLLTLIVALLGVAGVIHF